MASRWGMAKGVRGNWSGYVVTGLCPYSPVQLPQLNTRIGIAWLALGHAYKSHEFIMMMA